MNFRTVGRKFLLHRALQCRHHVDIYTYIYVDKDGFLIFRVGFLIMLGMDFLSKAVTTITINDSQSL